MDAAQTSLASADGNPRALVADEIGLGRAVYIGWNVYGGDATPNDVKLFDNALQWAATGAVDTATPVPEPSSFLLLGMGAATLFASRRKREVRGN